MLELQDVAGGVEFVERFLIEGVQGAQLHGRDSATEDERKAKGAME